MSGPTQHTQNLRVNLPYKTFRSGTKRHSFSTVLDSSKHRSFSYPSSLYQSLLSAPRKIVLRAENYAYWKTVKKKKLSSFLTLNEKELREMTYCLQVIQPQFSHLVRALYKSYILCHRNLLRQARNNT